MKRNLLIGSLIASTALLAGCGGGGSTAAAPSSSSTSAEATPSETSSSSSSSTSSSTSESMAPAAGPVGPGCAEYAAANAQGAGSIDGMAAEKVVQAASANPLLTQLAAAVSGGLNPDVNLVDTLNNGQFTVFAPVDSAFAALPPETVAAVKGDGALLTSVLTYHVLPGRIEPDAIVGTQTTVQGATVDVAGTPDMLTVNGANVICGGVQTENATVYLIDQVLMPPM